MFGNTKRLPAFALAAALCASMSGGAAVNAAAASTAVSAAPITAAAPAAETTAAAMAAVHFPSIYPPNKLETRDDSEVAKKADALLKTMTTAEKFSLLTQGSTRSAQAGRQYGTGYLPGVPRLGVPALRMWDGPKGVISNSDLETSAPSSELSLASSFSEALARRYGELTGSDNKATAGNVQLGIQLDNARSPFFMRSRDSLGEDPFLTGALGTSLSLGIESQNVMSTLKHMAVYTAMFHHPILAGMTGMLGLPPMPPQDDSVIDEQTLHEIYLLPYESIVKAKAASAIMSSYNMINGVPAANSAYIQNDVLRSMWGFSGLTMTDWGGTLDVGGAILKNGGDLEMGTSRYHTAAALQALIDSGDLAMGDIDAAVRHVLAAIGQIGYLGLVEVLPDGTAAIDPAPPASIELPETTGAERASLLEANNRIALESAVKGAVLLKNASGALPVLPSEKIAVIGLTGLHTLTGHYSEASFGWLGAMTSPYENLADIKGASMVDGFAGLEISGDKIDDGLLFSDAGLTLPGVSLIVSEGPLTVKTATMNNIELTAGTIGGKTNRTYKNSADGNALELGQTATLEAWFAPDASGDYEFIMQGIGGTIKASINDGSEDLAIPFQGAGTMGFQDANTAWPTANVVCTDEGMNIASVSRKATLAAGAAYKITVEATAGSASKDMQLRLTALKPGARDAKRAAAVAAAGSGAYDKVIVFVHDLGAGDKPDGTVLPLQRSTLALAADQLALLNDVAASAKLAGSQVIVVANIGLPISMDWINGVDAVLNMWLPGQDGGKATAQLLAGLENPSGKLPITFPAGDNDTQFGDIANSYADPVAANTVSEGIFHGYRWFDREKIAPLFAFGHGLSYAEFEYSGISVAESGGPDLGYSVTFAVKNVGPVKGSEVAQVYLGKADAPAGIQMAEKQLAGFARIEDLEPGESRTATVAIGRQSLSYWDKDEELITRADGTKDKWAVASGQREVLVGAASDDIRLRAGIDVVGMTAPAASAHGSANAVTLTWPAAANHAYKVAQKRPDGTYADLDASISIASGNAVATISGLSAGASYVFRVAANLFGQLAYSDDIEATAGAGAGDNQPSAGGAGGSVAPNAPGSPAAAEGNQQEGQEESDGRQKESDSRPGTAGQQAPRPQLDKSGRLGYVSGYPDGTFKPGGNITRYEAASMIYALVTDAGKAAYGKDAGKYSDAAAGQWYSEAVGYLAAAGIISGYEDGTFRGGNEMSRAELAAVASRFGELNLSGSLPFKDVPPGHWARGYIESAYNNGWIKGYPDGSFGPGRNITRAEAVVMLNRVLGRPAEPEAGGEPIFADLSGGEWFYGDVAAAAKQD